MKHLKLYEGYINDFYDRHVKLYNHTNDRKKAIRSDYQSHVNKFKRESDRDIDALDSTYMANTKKDLSELSKLFTEVLFTLIEDYSLFPTPFFNSKIDTEIKKGDNKFYIGYKFASDSGMEPAVITTEFIAEMNRANRKLNHMGMFIYMVYTDVDSPSRCSMEDLVKYSGRKAQSFLIAEL